MKPLFVHFAPQADRRYYLWPGRGPRAILARLLLRLALRLVSPDQVGDT